MTDQMRNPPSASSTPGLSQGPAAPKLCVSGCGFWGNPRTENMCSLCYKQHLAKGGAPASTAVAATSSSTSSSSTSTSSVSTTAVVDLRTSEASTAEASTAEASTAEAAAAAPDEAGTTGVAAAMVGVDPSSPSSTTDLPSVSPLSDGSDAVVSPSPSSSSSASSSSSPSPSLASTELASVKTPADATATATASDKKRKNRCTFCQKKVGLTFFACRCDELAMFCVAHRYPHAHQCTHDHRNDQQSKLLKSNPIVKNDQFEKM